MKAKELKPVSKESINKFQPVKQEANVNPLAQALQDKLKNLKAPS